MSSFFNPQLKSNKSATGRLLFPNFCLGYLFLYWIKIMVIRCLPIGKINFFNHPFFGNFLKNFHFPTTSPLATILPINSVTLEYVTISTSEARVMATYRYRCCKSRPARVCGSNKSPHITKTTQYAKLWRNKLVGS